MELNLEKAVGYHYDRFPPEKLDYGNFIEPLIKGNLQKLNFLVIARHVPRRSNPERPMAKGIAASAKSIASSQ